MEKVMALAQAEIEKLRQENQNIKEEKETLSYQLKQMLGKIFKPQVKPDHDVNRPKRGAPCGHRGNSRRRPEEITELIEIYPDKCDRCGGQIKAYEKSFDEHVVEDIEIKKKVTCYRLHYGYCKQCKKVVYPKAKEAVIPGDRIGVQARAVGGYLRYLGLPYRKATRIFKNIFGINLTHPSFLAFNAEQAQNGAPIYEAIKEGIRHSACVNGDETGWRVNGQNHWLWVFTNKDAAFYQIDKSRGSKVVSDILGEKYQGVLISDFYSAYNKPKALAKQRCLGHLLAEIKKIQEKNKFVPDSIDGIFCQELKTLLKQMINVWNEYHEGTKVFEDLVKEKERAISRMMELLSLPIEHKDARRIRKRIIKFNQELFTFLDNPLVEPTNNRAERQLRPNVIMRKITFGNRSALGASNQAVIMSIIQTGILNGIEPLNISLALSVKPLTSFTELPKIRSP
ncbi:MAG: IS66 family transposase [Dehalococcoidia bacterium]|nr:IS66 family transposase [Dehalococcoidia bacterium]